MEEPLEDSSYIWKSDLKSDIVAAVVFSFGVRTWRDLAELDESRLKEAGLDSGEVSSLKNLLALRQRKLEQS